MNEWRTVKLGNLDSLEIGVLRLAIDNGRIIESVTPQLKRVYRRYCQQTGRLSWPCRG